MEKEKEMLGYPDSGANSSGQNGSSSSPLVNDSMKGFHLNITVCDPVKQEQGALSAYITYKINTSTDRQDFHYGHFSVIRRYRDFLWLRDCLGEEFPGIINPPLPMRRSGMINRFEPEFIERRRKDLERYLNRVASHEELSSSNYFMTFLQADDAALAEKKEEDKKMKAQLANKGLPGVNFSKWIEDAISVMKLRVGIEDGSKSETDKQFEHMEKYVNELDLQIHQVAKQASNLVKKQKSLGSGMYNFGFAFTQLASSERDIVSLGEALQHMGEKADSVSVAWKSQALKEGEAFEIPIYDYVKLIAALKAAMAKRQELKVKYMAAVHEVDVCLARCQKIEGIAGKEEKLSVARDALSTAQATMEIAKGEFEQVTTRLLREFERFLVEKSHDLKKIMLDYVNIQIEYARKIEANWTELVTELEGMGPDLVLDEGHLPSE